jgi:hypothetical protein
MSAPKSLKLSWENVKWDAVVQLSVAQFAMDPRICIPAGKLPNLKKTIQLQAALEHFALETENGYFGVRLIKNQQPVNVRLPNNENFTLRVNGPRFERNVTLFQPKSLPRPSSGKHLYGVVSIESKTLVFSPSLFVPSPAENITKVTFTYPFQISETVDFRCVEFISEFNQQISTSCVAGEDELYFATCECNHFSKHSSEQYLRPHPKHASKASNGLNHTAKGGFSSDKNYAFLVIFMAVFTVVCYVLTGIVLETKKSSHHKHDRFNAHSSRLSGAFLWCWKSGSDGHWLGCICV